MLTANGLTKQIFIIIAASLVTSCSQNSLAVKDTLLLSFQKNKGVTLSKEQIQAIPYASAYAQKSGKGRAFLVLSRAEPKYAAGKTTKSFQLKWLSANNEMIATEQGRIVKTLNFSDGNLHRSYSMEPDPLALGLLNSSTPKKWLRFLDWQPGNYNHVVVHSNFIIAQKQNIDINGEIFLAQHIIENVTVPSLDISYQNQFWLHPTTQNVIATIQRPAPLISEIEIQILKPFSGG